MAFIIAEPCISTCSRDCVQVCPVDCIHGPLDQSGAGGEVEKMNSLEGMQLYINPRTCIDCGACEHVCPPNAIFHENAVPAKWKSFIIKNKIFFNKDQQASVL